MIDRYNGIAPRGDLLLLQKLGEKLAGRSFLHVNSTRQGGGVAEILQRMLPILQALGIETRWEVIEGDDRFFDITKKIHNAMQGDPEQFSNEMWDHHREVNRINAQKLDLEADAVLIHDPQPAPLIEYRKTGRWIWRCHIDVSNPLPAVAQQLNQYCASYAAVFSVSKFAQALGIDEFIIPPSIDRWSNRRNTASDRARDHRLSGSLPGGRCLQDAPVPEQS